MKNSASRDVATNVRLMGRSFESLLGIAAGIVADGEVNRQEIQFLSTWLAEHGELAMTWPGEVIFKRVQHILTDGVISEEECLYMQKTLTELIGGSFSDDGVVASAPIALPVDIDAAICISQATFCFTGLFVYGTRAACERAVSERGGSVGAISRKLDYLVIGSMSSRDWKNTSFGTKIEKAMNLKQNGADVSIVTESQWVAAL
jgi:NAD-dependent DNA ligase